MAHGGIPRDIESERCLADRRACRDDDEIRRVEAREQIVECGVTRGNTANAVLMLAERLDAIPRCMDFVSNRGELVRGRGVTNRVNTFLRFVEHFHRLARIVVGGFSDAICRIDKRAHQMLTRDKFSIVGKVSGRRCRTGELGKITSTTTTFKQTLILESCRKRQLVNRFATIGKFAHGTEDKSMFFCVKGVWMNEVRDIMDSVRL